MTRCVKAVLTAVAVGVLLSQFGAPSAASLIVEPAGGPTVTATPKDDSAVLCNLGSTGCLPESIIGSMDAGVYYSVASEDVGAYAASCLPGDADGQITVPHRSLLPMGDSAFILFPANGSYTTAAVVVPPAVPEPTTLTLFGAGAALACLRRRKRSAASGA